MTISISEEQELIFKLMDHYWKKQNQWRYLVEKEKLHPVQKRHIKRVLHAIDETKKDFNEQLHTLFHLYYEHADFRGSYLEVADEMGRTTHWVKQSHRRVMFYLADLIGHF